MSGKRRNWLWRHRRALFLVWLFVGFGVAGGLYLLSQVKLPPAQVQTQTTFINYANGQRLAAIDSGQNRVAVHLNQVPRNAINAVLSAEDRNFYHHGGVDPLGVVRALISDLRGHGTLQGGSTITQQYVKQTYLTPQRSILRKLKEAALAVKLERKLTKDQILERYLNTIYWGRGAYGIQAASQAYFHHDVSQLTISQSALLAGLIRAPELADPSRQPAAAAARRADTLRAMMRDHHITEVQAQQAANSPLGAQPPQDAGLRVSDTQHGTEYFVDYVRQQLQQRYNKSLGAGLRITTTLDPIMQDQAYDAIYAGPTGLKRSEPAGALVAVDDNGQVKAMVGGRGYRSGDPYARVDLALGDQGGGSGRQPGSTFKPFLLAETVKEGYTVQSRFPAPAKIVLQGRGANGTNYEVDNFDNEAGGPAVSLVDATAQSLNTVYAQLEMAIGPDRLVNLAHQLGLRPHDIGLAPNASVVLGTAQVSVLEMSAAYATFARGGTYLAPQVISRVTTADGTPLPLTTASPASVLTRQQTDQVDYCLQQVVQRGTGTGAGIGTPVAGKTGTTSSFTDAWFIGYTPRLTAAVWMGYPNGNQPMIGLRGVRGGVQGGSIPASLWRRFMAAVTANGNYTGTFDPVSALPGKVISAPSTGIGYPAGTGITTTVAPPTTKPNAASPGVRPTTTVPRPPTTPATGPPTTPPATAPKPTTTIKR